MKDGVPVDEKIWEQIKAIAEGKKVTEDLTK